MNSLRAKRPALLFPQMLPPLAQTRTHFLLHDRVRTIVPRARQESIWNRSAAHETKDYGGGAELDFIDPTDLPPALGPVWSGTFRLGFSV